MNLALTTSQTKYYIWKIININDKILTQDSSYINSYKQYKRGIFQNYFKSLNATKTHNDLINNRLLAIINKIRQYDILINHDIDSLPEEQRLLLQNVARLVMEQLKDIKIKQTTTNKLSNYAYCLYVLKSNNVNILDSYNQQFMAIYKQNQIKHKPDCEQYLCAALGLISASEINNSDQPYDYYNQLIEDYLTQNQNKV